MIWSLDLADTSETAVRAAAGLLSEHGVEAAVVDPNRWLTWHFDRSTVESLAAGLRAGLATGEFPDVQVLTAVQSLLEDCQRWLDETGDEGLRR